MSKRDGLLDERVLQAQPGHETIQLLGALEEAKKDLLGYFPSESFSLPLEEGFSMFPKEMAEWFEKWFGSR